MRRTQLLQAFDFLGSGYGEAENFDEAGARADWREHRDELLTYWTQPRAEWLRAGQFGFAHPEPGGPGTRPAAWWWFDAPPELQQRLAREGGAPIYEDIRPVLKRHGMLVAGDVERASSRPRPSPETGGLP
jgi:hypothetical protein